MPNTDHPIVVPPGSHIPPSTSPPFGISFGRSPVIGGKILSPSLITACRYGNFRASSSVIGFDIGEEISARRVERMWGLVTMWSSVERMVVAEVSAPAKLSPISFHYIYCVVKDEEYTHLQHEFRPCLPFRKAVTEEGTQHIPPRSLLFNAVHIKPLLDGFFRNPKPPGPVRQMQPEGVEEYVPHQPPQSNRVCILWHESAENPGEQHFG
jgi:hypothetical protein